MTQFGLVYYQFDVQQKNLVYLVPPYTIMTVVAYFLVLLVVHKHIYHKKRKRNLPTFCRDALQLVMAVLVSRL